MPICRCPSRGRPNSNRSPACDPEELTNKYQSATRQLATWVEPESKSLPLHSMGCGYGGNGKSATSVSGAIRVSQEHPFPAAEVVSGQVQIISNSWTSKLTAVTINPSPATD